MTAPPPRRILLASLGATLRGDDGFGPKLLARMAPRVPAAVSVRDFGTHGVALVQALFERFDVLVLLDASRRGGRPGTVYTIRPVVPEVPSAVGAHLTGPASVLMLARMLGVLPPDVWLIGCEPKDLREYQMGLSRPVRRAMARAAGAVEEVLRRVSA